MPQPDNTTYRIISLDDHPMVIEGLSHILFSFEGISHKGISKASEMTALLAEGQCFDLFILDMELPDADGFEVLSSIRRHCPKAAILIYTMHEEPWILARLASLDIQGVVSKSQPVTMLVKTIEAIRGGGTFFDENFLQMFRQFDGSAMSSADKASMKITLSDREQEVLRCIAGGLTTAQIAEALFLSQNTVSTYRKRLMTKFGTHNVAQLICKARQYI